MLESEEPLETLEVINDKPKKTKGKKRLSDFEIVRTLLQRATDRRLPYLLKNMGEDSDILFLASEDEENFVYGSNELSISIIEITDPDLRIMVNTFLDKLEGIDTSARAQLVVNVKDQISELAKTKGESMDIDIIRDIFGTTWTIKTDVNGKEKTMFFSKAITSLFHYQMVGAWCRKYRDLLTTEDPNYIYYPYTHTAIPQSSLLRIENSDPTHPIFSVFPHGLRTMITKGIDVFVSNVFDNFPYPVIKEEIIIFNEITSTSKSAACHLAHRIIGEGWRMVLLRPNSVFFPTLSTPIPVNKGTSL